MGRSTSLCALVAAVISSLLIAPAAARSARTVPDDRIWFSPDPGTLDFVRLFERPGEWSRARAIVRVFKFYHQHTRTPPPSIVGPNTVDALVRADVFRTLQRWGMKTALEIGSVKQFHCTADSSGMEASSRDAITAINAVRAAGGTVDYLAQDEPWVSGREFRECGAPALEPTADRVAEWMSAVQRAFPTLSIGLIEAYPFSRADTIEAILHLMRARGVPPAFLHMDVDWHLLGPGEFQRDMRRLRDLCASLGIQFGIIITGYDGDADALYAVEAAHITNLIADTFQQWESMPDHLIFQSWAVSSTGLLITPSNLPETRIHTHTNLVWHLFRLLRGSATGVAIPRGDR